VAGAAKFIEQDFDSWFKGKFCAAVFPYIPADKKEAFSSQFDKQKWAFLGDALTSWMADIYWEGSKAEKVFVGSVKAVTVGKLKFDHADAYQLPKRVWLMLLDCGLPKGVAAVAGEAACIACGIGGYTNNPSFREQAADYAGISRKAPEVGKLSTLWPLVLKKYAGSVNTKDPHTLEAYFVAVKEGERAATKGPIYSKAYAWNSKGTGDDPKLTPYVKSDVAKLSNLVLTFPHYALTDLQSARLEMTKDGWYYLGSILLAKGGCPTNLVPQQPPKGVDLKDTAQPTSGAAPVVAVAAGAVVLAVLV
jgi:hypothetical protein